MVSGYMWIVDAMRFQKIPVGLKHHILEMSLMWDEQQGKLGLLSFLSVKR